jgi:deoxyribonuclease-4
VDRIVKGIHQALERLPSAPPRLLLETTAGQGSSIGGRFEDLAAILEGMANPRRIGVCLDSCHIFAAGYDLKTPEACRKTMDAFDRVIGVDKLSVIHLNDSRHPLGSRLDRHENIGKGAIGMAAFEFFMNDPAFQAIPKILETPKRQGTVDWDRINLATLREQLAA